MPPDRLTQCSDLIFFVCGSNSYTQSRGAFSHGGIADCWNEKSVILQPGRKAKSRLLAAHDPWENRAARVAGL